MVYAADKIDVEAGSHQRVVQCLPIAYSNWRFGGLRWSGLGLPVQTQASGAAAHPDAPADNTDDRPACSYDDRAAPDRIG